MSAPGARRRAQLLALVLAQQHWMDERGGSLAGYLRTYGAIEDPDHQGDGGRAIWDADSAALARLVRAYECAVNFQQRRMRS